MALNRRVISDRLHPHHPRRRCQPVGVQSESELGVTCGGLRRHSNNTMPIYDDPCPITTTYHDESLYDRILKGYSVGDAHNTDITFSLFPRLSHCLATFVCLRRERCSEAKLVRGLERHIGTRRVRIEKQKGTK